MIFLFPDRPIISILPAFRLIDIIFILLTIHKLFKTKIENSSSIFTNYFKVYICMLIFSMCLSIFSTYLLFNQEIVINDLMIIFQAIKYVIVYSVVFSNKYDKKEIEKINKTFLIIGIIVPSIGICQHLNILKINEIITPIFLGKKGVFNELLDGIYIQRRVTGTQNNPNFYGYHLLMILNYNLNIMLINKKNLTKIFLLLANVLCSIAIILTISRTTILGLFGIILFLILSRRNAINKKNKLLGLAFIAISFTLVNIYIINNTILNRVSSKSDSFNRSYSARIRDFKNPFYNNTKNLGRLLFGYGPYKAKMRTDSHNEFGWYFQRFGIIGISIYLLFLNRIRKEVTKFSKETTNMYHLGVMVFSVFILFCFSSNMFKMPTIMVPTIYLIAFIESINQKIKMNEFL